MRILRPVRPSHPARARMLAAGLAAVLLSGCSMASAVPSLREAAPLLVEAVAEQALAPRPTAGKQQQRARLRPYTLDLYRRGDHVPQYHGSWCVGASMQMMINMTESGAPDRSSATQSRLYDYARRVSPWEEQGNGASVFGWAEGLEQLGHGSYEEVAAPTMQEALRLAAKQMRSTKRPVGLLVWDGAHAWVMSGFKATADPARTDDFTVTHVWVEDPYAGRVSPGWGPGLRPHTLLTPTELGRDFVRHGNKYRPQYGSRGMYVMVAPVADRA